ncbi:hypothetical protein Tco_0913923 [Tanacetum coccineum]
MAETMEQYMSKTRSDYGSGVVSPKIEDKDNFELKGQFLNELRTNTFSGLDHEDANEHIEKVLEIMDLFHILNITIDQVMLIAFPMSLTGAASRWLRNKPYGLITLGRSKDKEVVLFYNGLDVPTRQILDSRGAIPSKTVTDAKVTIQEMVEYSQKWHNGISRPRSTKTSDELAAIQAQLNNLRREIKKVNEKVYAAQVGCEQCKGPHYTKDFPLKEEGKPSDELTNTQFVKSISTIVEADASSIRRIGSHQYAVSTGQKTVPDDEDRLNDNLVLQGPTAAKKSNEVGKYQSSGNPMSDCSHAGIQHAFTTQYPSSKLLRIIHQAKYQVGFSF